MDDFLELAEFKLDLKAAFEDVDKIQAELRVLDHYLVIFIQSLKLGMRHLHEVAAYDRVNLLEHGNLGDLSFVLFACDRE